MLRVHISFPFEIAPLKMWTTLIEPLVIVELREKVERSRLRARESITSGAPSVLLSIPVESLVIQISRGALEQEYRRIRSQW